MRSSTSNSDIHLTRRFIPGGRWIQPLLMAMLLGALFVGGLEVWLGSRGFRPTVIDSPALWVEQRARVDGLGARALVLIGASRAQLDLDLDTLRDTTGREPVQLAIDGSSFVPVLAELAADERVSGTILVDYQDYVVDEMHRQDATVATLAMWDHVRDRSPIPDFARTESWLSGVVHDRLRAFADGSSPYEALTHRALDVKATPQYLITRPNRERLADYTLVPMPQFYFARVIRESGVKAPDSAPDWPTFNMLLAQRVDALPVAPLRHFGENTDRIADMVRRIEARGGHVVFMMFPRSGLMRIADDRRYPRATYWDRFVATVGAPALHYSDVPAMDALICPDGSHLDRTQRVAFTRDLVQAMPLLRGDEAGTAPRMARNPSPQPSQEQVP